MRTVAVAALLAASGCSGSDPREMAKERGAVELLRAWPCAKTSGLGARTLGDLVGGDLKTDWTAEPTKDAGAFRVTVRRDGTAEEFVVRPSDRSVQPETAGAKAAWQACNAK